MQTKKKPHLRPQKKPLLRRLFLKCFQYLGVFTFGHTSTFLPFVHYRRHVSLLLLQNMTTCDKNFELRNDAQPFTICLLKCLQTIRQDVCFPAAFPGCAIDFACTALCLLPPIRALLVPRAWD